METLAIVVFCLGLLAVIVTSFVSDQSEHVMRKCCALVEKQPLKVMEKGGKVVEISRSPSAVTMLENGSLRVVYTHTKHVENGVVTEKIDITILATRIFRKLRIEWFDDEIALLTCYGVNVPIIGARKAYAANSILRSVRKAMTLEEEVA